MGEMCEGTKNCAVVQSKEEIQNAWKTFMSNFVDNDKKPLQQPFYAVYDFGYYCAEGHFKSMLVLFSYIPAKLHIKTRMVYSPNVQAIKSEMCIPYLVEGDSIEMLDYVKIKNEVSRIQGSN